MARRKRRSVSWVRSDIGADSDVNAVKQKRKRKKRTSPLSTPISNDMPATTRMAAHEAIDPVSKHGYVDCPVCRSSDRCGCTENDRAFVRRTRFEVGVERVARCSICRAPLSVAYVRRPGVNDAPYELSEFHAVYCCGVCSPAALCSILLRCS